MLQQTDAKNRQKRYVFFKATICHSQLQIRVRKGKEKLHACTITKDNENCPVI